MNRSLISEKLILLVFLSVIHLSFSTIDTNLVLGNTIAVSSEVAAFVPPTFTGCDATSLNVQVTYTTGECGGTVTWNPPTASSDAVTVTSNYQPGDNILPGTTAIIYRAENAAGEVGICTFNVTVEDNEKPVFDTFPSNITLTADPNTCTATHSWAEPTVSDNCPAGEGEAPVLQDFESFLNQCYVFTKTSIGNGGQVNGSRNLVANSLSIASFYTSTLVTPTMYFNGEGEISFSHVINTVGNNAQIHIDILDEDDAVVQTDFFSKVYTDTAVHQENIPFILTGNYRIKIRYSSSVFNNTTQVAYLDDFLLPGTIVTNLTDTDCVLAEFSATRSDGNGKVNGDEFDIGTTTIVYRVFDANDQFTTKSFTITVENDLNPPTGASEYSYCEGDTPPEMTVSVDEAVGETANWYDTEGNLVASNTTTYTAPTSTELFRNFSVYSVNANGCSSDTFISIDLYQFPLPSAPTADSPLEYCVGDTAVPLQATGDSGNTLQWYDANTGGTLYTSDPVPTTTTAGSTFYYVQQTSAFTGCISPRTAVEVIVHALPASPTLVANTVNYCVGDTAQQLDDYVQTGANLIWYDAASGGNVISGNTIPLTTTAGITDYWVTQTQTAANCESLRRRLRIIVNDPPVITNQPDNVEVCENEDAVFTVTAINTSTYQWQSFDGSNWSDLSEVSPYSGTSTNTLTINSVPVSLTNTRYRLVVSSAAASCADAISETKTLTVNPLPMALTVTDVAYCQNDTANALSASGTNLLWYTVATGGTGSATAPTPNTATVGTTSYYVTQTNANGCESPRSEIVVTINALPAAPTVSAIAYCQNDTASALSASGTNLLWYTAATGGTGSATAPTPSTATVGTTSYYVSQTNANGCESPRSEIEVTINALPTAPTVSDVAYCQNDTASALSASGTNLLWYTAAAGGTGNATAPTPSTVTVGTTSYYVSQTNGNGCEGPRSEIVVTVYPQPTAPTVSDLAYCQNDTASALSASGTNLLWYTVATGGTGSATAPTPNTATVGTTSYYVTQTNANGCESPRSEIVVTINALPAAPTVSAIAYCQNDTASALSASGTNLLWYTAATGGAGSTTAPTPSTATVGTTSYYVSQTNANGCESPRSEIEVTINALPSAPTVSDVAYCQNDMASALSASGTNLLWYAVASGGTGSATSPTPSTVTVGTTSYYVSQTNTNGCESPRSEIVVTVYPQPTAPTVSDVAYCQNDTASALSASGTNLLWYTVATGGSGSTTAPTPNTATVGTTSYYVTQTNANGCESLRSEIVVTINALPTAPTVSDVAYCQNDTANALSASGTNLLWYTAATGGTGSATAPIPSTATVGITSYYVSQTNANGCESLRSEIEVMINALPTAPGVTSPVVYCQNDTASALSASGTNLLWYTVASGGTGSATAPTPSSTTAGDTSYYVSQTNANGCEGPRSEIVVTVYPLPTISTSSSPTCSTDLTTYSVSVNVNTGTVTSTAGTVTDNGSNNWTISGVNSGTDIVITVTNGSTTCANTLSVTAPDCSCPVVAAPGVASGDLAYCVGDTIPTISVGVNSGETVDWYSIANGGTAISTGSLSYQPASLGSGVTTFYAQARNITTGCTSSTRRAVSITQYAVPTAPTASAIAYCQNDTASALSASGTNLLWYTAAMGGTGSATAPTPSTATVGTTSYYVSQTNANGCESPRSEIEVTINALPSAPTVSDVAYCQNDMASALSASGTNLLWYAVASGGTGSATSPTPSTVTVGTTSYYVSQTNTNGCESPRSEIVVTVYPQPTAPTVSDVAYCQNDTASALSASGTNLLWYTVATGGSGSTTAPTPNTATVGTTSYYVTQTNANGCESLRSEIVVTINALPTAPTVSDVAYCQNDTANALSASGTNLLWYTAATGGTGSATAPIPSTATVGITSYYVSQTNANGCESLRSEIEVMINALPTAPGVTSPVVYCQNDTASALSASGTNLLWYTVASGGTGSATAPTPSSTTAGDTSYYVSQTNANGCEGPRSEIVVTVYPLPTISTSSSPTCSTDLTTYSVSVNVNTGTVTSTAGTVTDNGSNNWTISGVNSGTDIVITVTNGSTTCANTLSVTAPDCSCPVVAAPGVASGDLAYCVGDTIPTISVGVNSGETVDWYSIANGGTAISTGSLSYQPASLGSGVTTFYAQARNITTGCTSSTRRAVSITQYAVPTAPTASAIAYCQNDTASALSASGTNLLWYTAAMGGTGSATAPTPSTATVGTTSYYVSQTNANGCESPRSEIEVTINALPTAPTVSDVAYCQNDMASALSASGTNLLWYAVASGGTGNATEPTPSTVTVGTISYYVSQTNGNGCEGPRSEIVVRVYPQPTAPTVSDVAYCQDDTASALSASGTNLLWYTVATGGTGSTTAPTPNTTTVGTTSYYVTQTNANGCESLRSEIVVTINALPTAPTVSDVAYCQNDTANALSASGTNLLWYTAATGGTGSATAPIPSTATVGTTSYYVSQTNTNGCESLRSEIEVTINALPTAPGVTSPVVYCQNDTASALSASGTNLLWYTVATGGTGSATAPTPSSTTAGDTSYYVSQTNANGCEGPRSEIVVTIYPLPTISTSSSPTCSTDLTTYSVSVNVNTGTVTSTAGTVTDNGSNNWTISGVNSGTDIVITVTNGSTTCANTLSVTAPDCSCPVVAAPGVASGDLAYCVDDTIPTISVGVNSGETVDWYSIASGGTAISTGSLSYQPASLGSGVTTFYAQARNITTGCTSSTRRAVSITQYAVPTAPTASAIAYCQNDTASALSASGTNLLWYTVATGGTGSTTAPTPSTAAVGTASYYVSQTNANGCESPRSEIVVTINALPVVVANASQTSINAGESVVLTGSGASSYIWDNGATDGGSVTPLVTTTYMVTGTNTNGCERTDSVTITVAETSDLSLTIVVNNASPNVGDPVIFTLTVNNDGPTDAAAGVVVKDLLPSGYTYASNSSNGINGTYDAATGDWVLPNLINGASVSLDIMATVNAPTSDPTEYINSAEVTNALSYDPDSMPNNDDGDQSEDDEDSISVAPLIVDLELVNSISPSTANPGELVTIFIEITNTGAANATNISIANYIPIGFSVSTIANGGTQVGNTITWDGLAILSGDRVTISFEAIVNIPTNVPNEYLNSAQVTQVTEYDMDSTPNNDDGDQSEDDEDNTILDLIPADLSLTKAISASSVSNPNAGDSFTFEISVENVGPGIATNVSVMDVLPVGYTLNTVNNGGVVSGNTIEWQLVNVPIGIQVLSYEVSVNVPSNTLDEYKNIAQITASDQFDPDSTPNNDNGDQSEDDEAYFSINAPTVDLEVLKTVDKEQTYVGDLVTFTITVLNNSAYAATNIGLEDVLPAGYTMINHTQSLGTYDESIGMWDIPLLEIGETAVLEMTVGVTEFTNYTNVVALVYVDQIDTNMSNDRDEVTPEVTQEECLTVFNEFSPNNDGANDFFFIECIDKYPNNTLQVFNRWGAKVYEAKNYKNNWNGTSKNGVRIGREEKLPSGTYYYLLNLGEDTEKSRTGWLYIIR